MNVTTDTELKVLGMEALIAALGEVRAEKFITLMNREQFDYTEWQRNLWADQSVEALSKAAMVRRKRVRLEPK
jgi:hypothetical protein